MEGPSGEFRGSLSGIVATIGNGAIVVGSVALVHRQLRSVTGAALEVRHRRNECGF